MDAAAALTRKIRDHIPLSEAMQFSIDELSLDSIQVSAPLEPNINIHGTGFAGSIYSIGILTGWALATHTMDELDMIADLVVGKAEIRYRAPVTSALICRSSCSDEQRQQFRNGLSESGKSRLNLEIEIGDQQALIEAGFIAVGR
jgi:thioesterase domain-containing protein